MWPRIGVGILTVFALIHPLLAQDSGFFAKSYAVVVGINTYRHPKWPTLNYAVKDAEGFGRFLESQGFDVISLTERQATKAAILSVFEDQLIPRLGPKDRVIFFFAGHGETRVVGSGERGYLVPADATDAFGSLIPVTQLHDLSDAMRAARHQLFILDSCFGGLAATRSGDRAIDPSTPDYLVEITRRVPATCQLEPNRHLAQADRGGLAGCQSASRLWPSSRTSRTVAA